ncbi:MAG: tRNA pseudouridine(38-40) synthase TruA, partial [Clostridia bacterium]|nr:tRNA pseudouridine(38-40) synthase TruA [Clostridia bacterium]
VRILAGTLIGVGTGKIERGAIVRALESGSRLDLGITAPAQGLTLMRIDYENADEIEDQI